MAGYVEPKWTALAQHPLVGQTRGKGLAWSLELVADKATKRPFPESLHASKRLSKILIDQGLSLGAASGAVDFTLGDMVGFTPPLIITREQVDEVLEILSQGLSQLAAEIAA